MFKNRGPPRADRPQIIWRYQDCIIVVIHHPDGAFWDLQLYRLIHHEKWTKFKAWVVRTDRSRRFVYNTPRNCFVDAAENGPFRVASSMHGAHLSDHHHLLHLVVPPREDNSLHPRGSAKRFQYQFFWTSVRCISCLETPSAKTKGIHCFSSRKYRNHYEEKSNVKENIRKL